MKRTSAFLIAQTILLSVIFAQSTHVGGVQAPPMEVWVNEGYGQDVQGYGADRFASLQEAIDAVGEGGTIYLSGTIYRGQSYPLRIHGKSLGIVGADQTEIRGNGIDDIFSIRGSNVSIDDCALTHGKNAFSLNNSIVDINGCSIEHNSGCGILSSASPLSDGALTLTNCIVGKNFVGVACISFPGSSMGINIINCTICDNLTYGSALLILGHGHPHGKIANCIVTSNGGYGIFTTDEGMQISNNDIWDNQGGNCNSDDFEGRFGNISKDPAFSRGYYPGIESPCIDAGLDADRPLYGHVSADLEGLGRPQGRGFDMGAYESAVIRVLQLSDLHLLAPVNGETVYGKGYDTVPWHELDEVLEGVEASGGADLVVITGDLVNWATSGTTYQTILGETYVVTEWEDTYKGYLQFKDIVRRQLGDIPILEVVGNHDYREHPYFFWKWTDTIGIDGAFLENINYSGYYVASVSDILGMELETDICIHLMNSGPDAIGSSNMLQGTILPYLAQNASNYPMLEDALGGGMDAADLYEFAENLAYGSGFDHYQIMALEGMLSKGQEDINLIFCHHPVVYPGITITENIDEFLRLCMEYGAGYVLSGHTHTESAYGVEWNSGQRTSFITAGSLIDGHYNLIAIQVGKESDIFLSQK